MAYTQSLGATQKMKSSVKPYLASKILYDNRNQQEYEKDIFMDFALRMGIENFDIHQPKPPKPDIIINIDKTSIDRKFTIGCELKDLYWDKKKKGSFEKKRFETWKSFAKKLRTDLDTLNNGFEYLYGVISLRDFRILASKHHQESLSKEIIHLLINERLPINTRFDSFIEQRFLSEHVEDIRIETYAERGILWWETSLLSGRTEYGIDIFEKEILQKNSKSHDFSECDEKWLLLFAEANNLGNSISFPFEEIEKCKIENLHKFDRVFFFDCFKESICQLYPEFQKVFEIAKNGSGIRYVNSIPKELIGQAPNTMQPPT